MKGNHPVNQVRRLNNRFFISRKNGTNGGEGGYGGEAGVVVVVMVVEAGQNEEMRQKAK